MTGRHRHGSISAPRAVARHGAATNEEVEAVTDEAATARPRPPSSPSTTSRRSRRDRSARPVDLAALRAALGGPLPDGPTDPTRGHRGPGRGRRPGARRQRRPALLRVRDRRRPAGRPRRRLAGQRLGPERRRCTSRRRPPRSPRRWPAGWLVELLGLPAGTSVGFVTGATMANFTAHRRGTSRGPGAGRLGRRAARPPGRAARSRSSPTRAATSPRLRVAPDARPRPRG